MESNQDKKFSPLITAIHNNDLDMVNKLISQGASVNETIDAEEGRETPLSIAIQKEDYDLIKVLLERGADVNASLFGGSVPAMSPLSYAFERETVNNHIIDLLLEYKADINGNIGDELSPIGHAILNSVDKIGLLIERGVDVNGKADINNATPVLIAVRNNCPEALKYLISRGAGICRPRVVSEEKQLSLLGVAVANNYAEIADILLNNSVDPNEQVLGEESFTPLEAAVSRNNIDVARVLLNHGADPNKAGAMGAFCIAIKENKIDFIKLFLEYKADVLGPAGNPGFSPMYLAISKDNAEVVRIFLEKGINVNAQVNGLSLFINAVYSDAKKTIKLLVQFGANVNADPYQPNFIPLEAAITANKAGSLKALIENGARMNVRMSNRTTPLGLAIQQGNIEVGRILLSYGANPNEPVMESNFTPLCAAINSDKTDFAELLLNYRADPNMPSVGFQPLGIAVMMDNSKVIRLLIKFGAQVNQYYDISGSPLYIAINNSNESLVDLLIENGADLRDASLLFAAIDEGDIDIFNKLIRAGAGRDHLFDFRSQDWFTYTSIAIEEGRADKVRLLIRAGVPLYPLFKSVTAKKGILMQKALWPVNSFEDMIFDYEMGMSYLTGQGLEETNLEKAVRLFRKSAIKGLASAQYMLGVCYNNGTGIAQDKNLALVWITNAANSGDPNAKQMLTST